MRAKVCNTGDRACEGCRGGEEGSGGGGKGLSVGTGIHHFDGIRVPPCNAQGNLPSGDGPNWHLGKLKPWQHQQAVQLGKQYKAGAMAQSDPFKKLFGLEEACKMFNKV